MQFFVTNLNAQSFQHKLQAKVFGSLGFHKVEAKYLDHAKEEAEFVDQFIDRRSEEQLGLIECIGAKPWLMKTAI